MKYLRVKNWEKFQFPSDKPLPWIRFFTALLAPTKEPWYSELDDASKARLHHIWLMARIFNNRIPETWLTREKLNLKSKLNLDPLLISGAIWFEDENGLRLDCSRARIARSGVSESKSLGFHGDGDAGKGFGAEAAFERFWQAISASGVPQPRGRKTALRHFLVSVKSEADESDLYAALTAYGASGEVSRGYVQHAKTWLGSWRDWLVTPQPKAAGNGWTQRDDIREAARALQGKPEAAEYIAWVAPNGVLREDAVTYEEWQARQVVA